MTDRKNISVRLPTRDIERIDKIRKRDAGPFGEPTQADIVRQLVERGLDEDDRRQAKAKKEKKTR